MRRARGVAKSFMNVDEAKGSVLPNASVFKFSIGGTQPNHDIFVPQGLARECIKQSATVLTETQLRMDVDPEKLYIEPTTGAMVMPAHTLTEQVVMGAGTEVVPVGQLWLPRRTFRVNSQTVPEEKRRNFTFTVADRGHPLSLFLLGVRKKGKISLELVIYGRDSEPLQVESLRKLYPQFQESPIRLSLSGGYKNISNLTINLLGRCETILKITLPET